MPRTFYPFPHTDKGLKDARAKAKELRRRGRSAFVYSGSTIRNGKRKFEHVVSSGPRKRKRGS